MDKKTRPQKAAAPRAKKTAAPKAPAPLAPCPLADFPRDPQVWLKSSLRPDLRRKIERIVIVNDDDAERAQLLWYLARDEEAGFDRLDDWALGLWNLPDGEERLRAAGIVLKPVFTPSPTPPPASAELRAILKPQVTRLPWVECPDKLIAALFEQVRKDVGEPRPQAMPAYFPSAGTPAAPAPSAIVDNQSVAAPLAGAIVDNRNEENTGGAVVERKALCYISMANAWRAVFNLENTVNDHMAPSIDNQKKAFRDWAKRHKRLPNVVFRRKNADYFPAVELFNSMAEWRKAIDPAKAMNEAEKSGYLTRQD